MSIVIPGVSQNITLTGPGGVTVSGTVTLPVQTISQKFSVPGVRHPSGDVGPTVPCFHPYQTSAIDVLRNIVFHTDDAFVQQATKDAIDRLALLMNQAAFLTSAGRPLHIFNRPLLSNYAQDDTNPFWSHYEGVTHAINVHVSTSDQARFLDALHHELGHAVVGQKCVQIPTPGGGHGLDDIVDPALAMSEGWADFVALAIQCDQGQAPTGYWGQNWEERNPAVPPSPNIESNVARALWDLYDLQGKSVWGRQRFEDDPVSFPFKELYRVYSPTLATLVDGPLIPDVYNYCERLAVNNPAQGAQIMQVRAMHCL